MDRGLLILLSGPAGIGKSAVSDMVCADTSLSILKSISYTTREPKEFEREGRNFFFVNEDEFQRLESSGELLESSEFLGNRYGTRKCWVEDQLAHGHNILINLDVEGAKELLTLYDGPRTLSFFIKLKDLDSMERKLRLHGEEQIEERLKLAEKDMESESLFDCVVESYTIQLTADQIRTVIHNVEQRGFKDPDLKKGTVFRAGSFLKAEED